MQWPSRGESLLGKQREKRKRRPQGGVVRHGGIQSGRVTGNGAGGGGGAGRFLGEPHSAMAQAALPGRWDGQVTLVLWSTLPTSHAG